MHNINKATNDLNNYLTKITKRAFQWKISFNPDISKQAHKIVFFHKRAIAFHPPLTFNNIPVAQTNTHKHLGMLLDKKLNFEEHLIVGLSPSKKYFFICFNDGPSKMMKNALYVILKALFVLKIFKFLS